MRLYDFLSISKKVFFTLSLLVLGFASHAQPIYCIPVGGTPGDLSIDSVTIPGTTLNNSIPDNPYTDTLFADTGSTTATLQQGIVYTMAINIGSGGFGFYGNVAMWIDYNQNGVFDASEYVSVATDTQGNVSASFTVPPTALTGITGMRIRTRDTGDGGGIILPTDGCADYYTGETEDYYITIDTTVACTGIPAAGLINGPASLCPDSAYTLSLTGYTYTYGLTYQWLSSPSGSGTFTAITGATTQSYSAPGLIQSMDYELVITCTGTGLSDTSDIFTVDLNPPYMCYCNDSATLGGESFYEAIDSVTIPGTTLNNSTPFNPDIYSAYPPTGSTTATLQQGGTYNIAVNTFSEFGEDANIAMWIDYDQSGTYDSSEYTAVGADVLSIAEAAFTVPYTAITGLTGLRIRTVADFEFIGSSDACTDFFSGETEDYIITIDTTYPCAGTPVVATISGPDSVCADMLFTLGTTGYPLASGLTYQWLSRPAGSGSFTAISGATNQSYVDSTGILAPTDFQLVVTCSASGLSSTSTTFTIGMNPFYKCYCDDSLALGGSSFYEAIDSVTIPGTTLNNSTPFNPDIYSSYPATGSTTATLQQAGTYNIVVNNFSEFGELANCSMWIDYDHSGTFDSSEWTSVGTAVLGITETFFTVPLTALTGKTGLRIRTDADFETIGATDACTDFFSGETEDYIITIDTTYPCTGAPATGSISAPDSICPASVFTVSCIGATIATGLTYQWLSSPSGAGTFTPIAGATNIYFSQSQAAATDYEFVVTCSGSGLSDTSAIYTVNEFPFTECYCDSATLGGSSFESPIDSVAIPGTTLNNYTPDNPYTYSIYPPAGSTTATLSQGAYYTIVVNSNDGSNPATSSMWIDYDHSGTYDPSEWTSVGTNILGTAAAAFLVPATSLTGQTGMRIRTIATDFGELMGAGDACTDYFSGETEDYIITIGPGTPCAGTPVAGTISGPGSICQEVAFTLILSGYSTGSGVTFQWQSSPSGSASFTNLGGVTTPVYSSFGIVFATDYRVIVTCGGISDTSAVFTVNLNQFYNCYCSPATGTTLVSFFPESEMTEAVITPTTFDNTSMYYLLSPTTGYVAIPPTPASNTAVMYIDSTYNFTVTMDSIDYEPFDVGVWIDFNHNGVYDATEYTDLTADPSGFAGTFNGSVTIPATSLTGETGMRIASGDEGITTSCADLEFGEAVDFIVTINVGTTTPTYVSATVNTPFSVKAYPNPANKLVTVQTFGVPGNNSSILLTDITGRIIERITTTSNKTDLDLGNLDAGLYIIKYEDDEHTSVIKVNKQ